MEQVGKSENQSFWEHLDVLRASLVKIAIVTVAFGVVAFFFKDELFAVILAPKEADFITYRLLFSLSGWVTGAGIPGLFREIDQYRVGGTVFDPHESGDVYGDFMCIPLYFVPIIPFRVPGSLL